MPINKSNQKYTILALFFVIAIDTMGMSFVYPIFGTLFTGKTSAFFSSYTSMQWRNFLYGITIGISNLFIFLGAPILGSISDSIGRRKTLLFCLLGTSIGMGMSILGIVFNQVCLIILSRAWLGAVAASQIIAKASIIDISTQVNKASLLGIVSAANNAGYIVGPVIGGLLIDNTLVSWFNFTTPFYFAALLALLNAILLIITYRETLKTQITKKLSVIPSFKIFINAFTHKNIRNIALVCVCFQVGWALYFQTNFLSLIQKYNYHGSSLGYFYLWMGLILCLNSLVTVRIITRILKLKKIIYINLIIAIICCFVAVNNTEIGVWLGMLPMATAIALAGNALITVFSNTATANEQGWIMGVNRSLAALSWAITPPVAGILIALGFHIPMIIAGILFLLGTIIAVSQKIGDHVKLF